MFTQHEIRLVCEIKMLVPQINWLANVSSSSFFLQVLRALYEPNMIKIYTDKRIRHFDRFFLCMRVFAFKNDMCCVVCGGANNTVRFNCNMMELHVHTSYVNKYMLASLCVCVCG